MKKKPLVVQPHHTPSHSGEMSSSAPEEHWVTAVAAYPSTDLVVSGIIIIYNKLCTMSCILSGDYFFAGTNV